MSDGPDCGVLGLSFGRIEGFLGVCVGLYGSIFFSFSWDAGLFLLFVGFFLLPDLGGSGVLSHGASS